jgi:hypothetical protein
VELFAFMSPDEAIMRVMAGPLILSIIALLIAIPIGIWRMKMALNDPEKYRRLRAWEEEERERHKKAMAEAAATGVKVAKTVAKWLPKK